MRLVVRFSPPPMPAPGGANDATSQCAGRRGRAAGTRPAAPSAIRSYVPHFCSQVRAVAVGVAHADLVAFQLAGVAGLGLVLGLGARVTSVHAWASEAAMLTHKSRGVAGLETRCVRRQQAVGRPHGLPCHGHESTWITLRRTNDRFDMHWCQRSPCTRSAC